MLKADRGGTSTRPFRERGASGAGGVGRSSGVGTRLPRGPSTKFSWSHTREQDCMCSHFPASLHAETRLCENVFTPTHACWQQPPPGGQAASAALIPDRAGGLLHRIPPVWSPAPGCPGQQGLIWSGGRTVPQSLLRHPLRTVEPTHPAPAGQGALGVARRPSAPMQT